MRLEKKVSDDNLKTHKGIRNPMDGSQIHDILDNIEASRSVAQKRERFLMDESAGLRLDVPRNRAGMLDVMEEGQLDSLAVSVRANII